MMDTYGAFAPSESEVASYKEKLDNSKAEQKNLFLIIFQVSFFSWNNSQSRDSIEKILLKYTNLVGGYFDMNIPDCQTSSAGLLEPF